MIQISEKHNGFQNEADYEDVKFFLSSFKIEPHFLIGECVMALDPVASHGDQVLIGANSDTAARGNQISIPLTLVSAARAPRGSSNELEIALLEATALSPLKRKDSVVHNVLKESTKYLFGPPILPQLSSAEVTAYTEKTEEYFATELIGKLRSRAERSVDTAPAQGPSTPKA